nr:helix-turn-helix transcriptional regulator [uncultured Pseudomonas sp.]
MIIANTISERAVFHSVIMICGMKTLGSRIKHFREAEHLSQASLAKACGWASQSRIGNYETDAREPTLSDIVLIAKALNRKAYELLPEEFRASIYPPAAMGSATNENNGVYTAGTSRALPVAAKLIAQGFADGTLTGGDIEELRRMALHLIKKNAHGAQAPAALPEHLEGLAEAALTAAENGDNPEDLLKMVGHGLKKSQPKEVQQSDGKRKTRSS